MKRMIDRTDLGRKVVVCLALSLTQASRASATSTDWQSPEAIVQALYSVVSADPGVQRDWDRYRALFLDGARISVAIESGVKTSIAGMSKEELITQTEKAYAATGFHEIPLVTKVDRYGLMASVVSSFEIRLRLSDEKALMRGLNHFQLLNDGKRWWIVSNIGVIETAESPIPRELRPTQ